jgi:hypothetical protein
LYKVIHPRILPHCTKTHLNFVLAGISQARGKIGRSVAQFERFLRKLGRWLEIDAAELLPQTELSQKTLKLG